MPNNKTGTTEHGQRQVQHLVKIASKYIGDLKVTDKARRPVLVRNNNHNDYFVLQEILMLLNVDSPSFDVPTYQAIKRQYLRGQ